MGEALNYEAYVDACVLAALRGSRTFGELVSNLPGIYPGIVADVLERLNASLVMSPAERLLQLPGPRPHPVDWDWRFHPESFDYLSSKLLAHKTRDVALLACPSLFRALKRDFNRVVLADANPAWADHLTPPDTDVSWGDVSAAVAVWSDEFDSVIADPPWYSLDFERFLATAASLVRLRGVILLSWPSEGTRPGLSYEWTNLLEKAASMGLRFMEKQSLVLRYATPFFEGRALQCAGLPVLNAWRRADLAVFVRNGQAPKTAQSSPPRLWHAQKLGMLDLRFRPIITDRSSTDLRLSAIVPGDVLPTVSRRDERREEASVWTGANRIFRCDRPDLVRAVVKGTEAGVGAQTAIERALQRTLTPTENAWTAELEHHLRTLESTEAAEYDDLHGNTPSSSRGLSSAACNSRK